MLFFGAVVGYVFDGEEGEVHLFHKVAWGKPSKVKGVEVPYVRFEHHGRGNIEFVADLGKVKVKPVYIEVAETFIHKVAEDLFALDYFRPDFEHFFDLLDLRSIF